MQFEATRARRLGMSDTDFVAISQILHDLADSITDQADLMQLQSKLRSEVADFVALESTKSPSTTQCHTCEDSDNSSVASSYSSDRRNPRECRRQGRRRPPASPVAEPATPRMDITHAALTAGVAALGLAFCVALAIGASHAGHRTPMWVSNLFSVLVTAAIAFAASTITAEAIYVAFTLALRTAQVAT